jgi:hypothetical protein
MSQQLIRAAFGLALGIAGVAATPVLAQSTNPVVVEIFTSQGCSSCPPADEFAATLVNDPDVIVLALHVDYWDYIGWKDSFGNPAFTNRQKSYARAIGSRTIYTPQLIVAGQERIEGFDPVRTHEEISRTAAAPSVVSLSVTREGDQLVVRAETAAPLSEAAIIHLVRYRPSETVKIERGENRGRTITYHNIVTKWEQLGNWSGTEPLEMTVPVPGAGPSVILIQEPGPAKILAAARAD